MSDRRHSSRRLALVGALAIAAGATVPALLVTQAAAADEFIPGSATALAQGLQLAPATGGLNYAISKYSKKPDYQIFWSRQNSCIKLRRGHSISP